jgi:hypothetical protein
MKVCVAAAIHEDYQLLALQPRWSDRRAQPHPAAPAVDYGYLSWLFFQSVTEVVLFYPAQYSVILCITQVGINGPR